MPPSIGSEPAQLHPLLVALKRNWRLLIVNHEIKQDWLAMRCKVHKGTVSKWVNPDEPDFPPTHQMANLIEAMQEWPGVEPWEPLEALNLYFGCRIAALNQAYQSLHTLAGLLALDSGKVLNLIIQATTGTSEGGIEISPSEAELLGTALHHLRMIVDQMDDSLAGQAKGAAS